MSVSPSVAREVEGDGLVLSLAGDWTVANSAALEATADSLSEPAHERGGAILDLSRVDRMDTAGAWAIDRARAELAGAGVHASYRGARPEYSLLLKEAGYQPVEPPKPTHLPTAISLLSAVGESVYTAGHDLAEGVSFFGEIVAMTIRLLPFPHRWRWTSIDLPPRELLAAQRADHRADQFPGRRDRYAAGHFPARPLRRLVYAVDLVGVLGLREMGVLMTAIMIAGRTGSAITAEIGSMNMREEIDALRVMALDPLEVLIMPRLVALVIALPVLTFVADMATLAGGLFVAWLYGGMTPPSRSSPACTTPSPSNTFIGRH